MMLNDYDNMTFTGKFEIPFRLEDEYGNIINHSEWIVFLDGAEKTVKTNHGRNILSSWRGRQGCWRMPRAHFLKKYIAVIHHHFDIDNDDDWEIDLE